MRKLTLWEAAWSNEQLPLVEMSNRPIPVTLGGLISDMAPVKEKLDYEMDDDALNVHQTSHYLFYINRPDALEDMCLADFSTMYSHSNRESRNYQFYVDYFQQGNLLRRYFKYVIIYKFRLYIL